MRVLDDKEVTKKPINPTLSKKRSHEDAVGRDGDVYAGDTKRAKSPSAKASTEKAAAADTARSASPSKKRSRDANDTGDGERETKKATKADGDAVASS